MLTNGNGPSAYSPTETLLRLLLPLNDHVWSTLWHPLHQWRCDSTDPKTSLNHSIGSSDARCVQSTETRSTQADDSCLLGTPCSWSIILVVNSHHVGLSKDYPKLSIKDMSCWIQQCSACVAQNISRHHRPVIACLTLVKHQQVL